LFRERTFTAAEAEWCSVLGEALVHHAGQPVIVHGGFGDVVQGVWVRVAATMLRADTFHEWGTIRTEVQVPVNHMVIARIVETAMFAATLTSFVPTRTFIHSYVVRMHGETSSEKLG